MHRPRKPIMLCLAVLAVSLVVGPATFARARFGTWCTESYQNSWQRKLPNSWQRCSWFNNELDDTDTKVFYYSLNGAKPYFETSRDQVHTERVNLVFVNTHGGAWSTTSALAMWNQNALAYTSNMRLGDESYGTSILSLYACDTLKHSDGRLWTRWGKAMRGGLRIVTGSHSKLYSGPTTNECGEDYADNLQKRQSIRYAWKNAVSDWATSQDATVMATGRSSSDCANRRNNMKWQNYSSSFPRIRDNSIRNVCWTSWDNL